MICITTATNMILAASPTSLNSSYSSSDALSRSYDYDDEW